MRDISMSELTSVLPAWVPWSGPVVASVTMGAICLVVRSIMVRGALRASERSESWTERARHVHVARFGAAMAMLVLPSIGVLVAMSFVGPLSAIPRPAVTLVLVGVGVVAPIRLSSVVERHVHGPSDEGLLPSAFGLVISFAPMLALLGLGWFAPSDLGSWIMVPWLITVVAVIRLWLRAVLLLVRTPLAREADARASAIVERAALTLSVRVDRVIEFRSRQPNAFAFPWLNTLAFTTGLLETLDDEELEAITHHELAHLAESAGLTRLRQAQLYALVPIVATRPLFATFGVLGPIAAVGLFVAVTEIVRRNARAAEHASDSAAVESIHHSEVYGHALEKTYRIGLIPAVLRRSTHGQLHERLEAAGVRPDFDPPAPPSRARPLTTLVAMTAVLIGAWFSPWLAHAVASDDSALPNQFAATLPIYGTDPLTWLASQAEVEERWRDAAVLYEAASVAIPSDGYLRSEAVRLWAYAGECRRAELSLEYIDPQTDPDDYAYGVDEIDWCLQTGGLP
jgi:Zn-dependent protease with chaperone function